MIMRHRSILQIALVGIWLAAVLVLVLEPMPVLRPDTNIGREGEGSSLPLIWLADGLRNIVLFMPLGMAWSTFRTTRRNVVAIGLALSVCIELMQIAIPGRHSSALDIAANTLGTGLGIAFASALPDLLRPSRDLALRLSIGASAAVIGLLIMTSALSEPALPHSQYFGGWTLELAQLESYSGEVISARIGRTEIPSSGRITDSESMRAALLRNEPISIEGVAGATPSRLAPLVTIHDESEREILLVGVDGHDLVAHRRMRSLTLGLEPLEMRWDDALVNVHTGDSFRFEITPSPSDWRLDLDDAPPMDARWTPGRHWNLVVGQYILP